MTRPPDSRGALEGLIVADDLTGAADSAVAFGAAGLRTRVVFAGSMERIGGDADDGETMAQAVRHGVDVLALDTDSRRLDPQAACRSVATVVATAPVARFRMKKIDSTLRGNVGAETRAVMQALGCRLAICAPAFPGAERVTRAGIQWASGRVVGDVASNFAGLPSAHVELTALRGGSGSASLHEAAAAGARIVVVDAETDDDLDRIVALGSEQDDLLWVGSGGLGAALARATSTPAGRGPVDPPPHLEGPAMVVVGSATSTAAAQGDTVVAGGAIEVTVPASALIDGEASRGTWADQAASALARGVDVVVRIGEGDKIVPGRGRAIVDALAETFRSTLQQAPPDVLIATGGETALAFGRALGAHGLEVAAELEPGVVYSHLAGEVGLPMVTKAGAFGDAGTLARVLERLRQTTDQLEGLR